MEIISTSGLSAVRVSHTSGHDTTLIAISNTTGPAEAKHAFLDPTGIRELIGALQDALPEAPQLPTWEVSPEVHSELSYLTHRYAFLSDPSGGDIISEIIKSLFVGNPQYPHLVSLLKGDATTALKIVQYLNQELSIAVKKAPTYTLYDSDYGQYVSEISIEGYTNDTEVYIDWEHIPELIFKERSHAESLLKVAQEFGHLHEVEVVEVP